MLENLWQKICSDFTQIGWIKLLIESILISIFFFIVSNLYSWIKGHNIEPLGDDDIIFTKIDPISSINYVSDNTYLLKLKLRFQNNGSYSANKVVLKLNYARLDAQGSGSRVFRTNESISPGNIMNYAINENIALASEGHIKGSFTFDFSIDVVPENGPIYRFYYSIFKNPVHSNIQSLYIKNKKTKIAYWPISFLMRKSKYDPQWNLLEVE